jgi:hypothetical protein
LLFVSASTSASSGKNIKGNGIIIKEKLMIKGTKKRGKALKGVNILNSA